MGPNASRLYHMCFSESELKKVENNLLYRGWKLYRICDFINGFAIAEVSIIPKGERTDKYKSGLYKVIIDSRTYDCVEFDFGGYITNGINIYQRPNNKSFKIGDPCFDIKFVLTHNCEQSQYIIVTYRYVVDNVEHIYTNLYDFSKSPTTSLGGSGFKFDGYVKDLTYNTVEIRFIDFDEDIQYLFAVKKVSRDYSEIMFDPNEYIEQFDFIKNTSLYYKRSIILNEGDSLIEQAEIIDREVKEEIRKEREEQKWNGYMW